MYLSSKNLIKKYNLKVEDRLIITNLNYKSISKIYDIGDNLIQDVIDKEIIHSPWTYTFTVQRKNNKVWSNIISEQIFIDIDSFTNILMDREAIVNLEDLKFLISDDMFNIPLEVQKKFLYKLFNVVSQYIWKIEGATHKNIKIFSTYVFENIGYKPCLIVECALYLHGLVRLKELMREHKLDSRWKDYVYKLIYTEEKYKDLISDIDIIVNEYSTYSDKLASANIIMSKIYDFIGKRDLAVEKCEKAIKLDSYNIIEYLGDKYMYTYNSLDVNDDYSIDSNFRIIDSKVSDSELIILCSLDIEYFKKFGNQLLVMCSQLINQHIHIHLIGDEKSCLEIIDNSINILTLMCNLSNKPFNQPSFSIEDIPKNITDKKNFYACSRFIRCADIMHYFNKDIFIMDADMVMLDSPYDFFDNIKKYEIVATVTNRINFFSAWIRISIGNCYFKNNDNVKEFLNIMREYIIKNMYVQMGWGLDQNAIVYALYHYQRNNIPIDFTNAWKYGLPTRQGNIKLIL